MVTKELTYWFLMVKAKDKFPIAVSYTCPLEPDCSNNNNNNANEPCKSP